MPSTFHALPLAQRGESFLLQTCTPDTVSILVDVGRELGSGPHNTLAAHIAALCPSPTVINRLILTHEDADHCEGASQFIGEWTGMGRSIAQAWLPALWLPAAGTGHRDGWNISHIIKGAFETVSEIAELIEQVEHANANEQDDNADDGHNPADRITRPFRHPDEDQATARRESLMLDELFDVPEEGQIIDGTVPDLEQARDHGNNHCAGMHEAFRCDARDHGSEICLICAIEASVGPGWHRTRHVDLAVQLANFAIQTHKNIAAAVAACQAHRIRVRWFDHLLYASSARTKGGPLRARGGDPGFLTPVNAVEILPKRGKVSPRTMFFSLFLSRANRESLVFLRHQTEKEPAVLFTADSRLKVGRKDFTAPPGLPTQDRLLSTAPHHGSISNAAAYGVLKGWLGNTYPPALVQNGGHGVRRGAPGFKAVADRQCVCCIGSKASPVLVQFDAPSGVWHVPASPTPCSCR